MILQLYSGYSRRRHNFGDILIGFVAAIALAGVIIGCIL